MRNRLAILAAVAGRPRLWPTVVRVASRMARRGWWRTPPFLPLPTAEYVRFRMLTNYGAPVAAATAHDVVTFLDWCRQLQRSLRK